MNTTLKHRLIRASGFLLLFAAISTMSQPAYTQTGGPMGTEASQKADEFFRQGKALYKSGKLKEAHDAYRSAWELKRSYDIASNLGNTEIQLGLKRDAAEHYAFCIRNFPSSGGKTQLDHAKERFDQARNDVGALLLKVSADGAELFVDGKSVGRSPLAEEVFVEPGERTIEARLAGHEPAKLIVKAATGSTQTLTLTLVASTLPVPVASAVPLASASVSASAAPPPPPPASSAVVSDPPHSGGPSTPVLVTGGVVSGLAVVAGVVFTVLANGKASDADQQRKALVQTHGAPACSGATVAPECNTLSNSTDARATMSNLAAWSFLGAGGIGAATVIYALAAPKRGPRQEVRVVPVVTGTSAGLVIGGAW